MSMIIPIKFVTIEINNRPIEYIAPNTRVFCYILRSLMVSSMRFEHMTCRLGGGCSIQLSYEDNVIIIHDMTIH